MLALRLKPTREKSVLRKHPWIFKGAVQEIIGSPKNGETIRIIDNDRHFLAWAAFSAYSQICARIWSWDESDQINAGFLENRIIKSIARRESCVDSSKQAQRLVYAESDSLPGIIVDRYGLIIVVQFLNSGAEYWREAIIDTLYEIENIQCIYERSDVDARRLEGLEERTGILKGHLPNSVIEILENGLQYLVDIKSGHKTGFYLDQQINRLHLGRVASGKDVLDCFCYTGGFSVNALAGGASKVLSLDSSSEALAMCRKNVLLNNFDEGKHTTLGGDVFQTLRDFRDRNLHFDLIILDPPKFAPTIAQIKQAARGYKDINLLACKLLKPGGNLFTFSCSGGVSAELFQKIVAGAALDANADLQIIQRMYQSPDHPVAINFPEGEYLKGLVLRKN